MNFSNKALYTLLIIGVLALALLLAFNLDFTRDHQNTSDQDNIPQAWKKFEVSELGISFNYPPKYQDAAYQINSASTGRVATGMILLGGLFLEKCNAAPCSRIGIQFGAATPDYSAPRGASGFEGQGFIKRDNEYFLITLFGDEEKVDYQVEEIKSVNTTGIMLKGDTRPQGPGTLWPSARKAIFNLNSSSEYKAVTFFIDTIQVSEDEFKSILRTIELR